MSGDRIEDLGFMGGCIGAVVGFRDRICRFLRGFRRWRVERGQFGGRRVLRPVLGRSGAFGGGVGWHGCGFCDGPRYGWMVSRFWTLWLLALKFVSSYVLLDTSIQDARFARSDHADASGAVRRNEGINCKEVTKGSVEGMLWIKFRPRWKPGQV